MKLIVPQKPLLESHEDGSGFYSFVIHPRKMVEYIGDLDGMYGRKNLTLKVFKGEIEPLDQFVWGGRTERDSQTLLECTKIQNLAAIYGLAPRVYEIVMTEFRGKKCLAQVTDFAMGEFARTDTERNEVLKRLKEVLAHYGIRPTTIDPNQSNIISGKYLDFQSYKINDQEVFKKRIVERANTITDWGSKTGISYQDVDGLEFEGQRNTKRRIGILKMDEVDFKGKTVLDIGCSTGSFCRYASKRGAKRVVGVDIGDVPTTATEISIYFDEFNTDFYSFRFHKDSQGDYDRLRFVTGLDFFDIVFFLSVHQQVGYPTKYMKDLCKETLFLEGHSADKEETYRAMLKKDFGQVEFTGKQRNNARPAFRCKK